MATVDEVIDDRIAYVDDRTQDFQLFIDQLLDASRVFYENVVDQVLVQHIPLDVAADMMDTIVGAFPAVPDIIMPGFVTPAAPDISFTSIEHDITVLEAARGLLLTDLEDGGYGIDVNDEAQLIDRYRDRAAADGAAAVDEVERAFANRRFSEPPGLFFSALERAQENQRAAVMTASRDVYLKRADQFFQARQFAITTGGVLDHTRAEIKEIQFRIEEAKARYQLASYQAQLDGFRTQIAAAVDKLTLTVRVFEAQSTVAESRARLAAEKAKVFIGEYEANTRAFLGTMQVRLENAKNQLSAAASNAETNLKAATAGADVFTTVVAHALGGINAMVQKSSTGT